MAKQININTINLQTILDNVNALPEAGGGSGGSGLDTSDATATASDILSSKTAYANNIKITGTMTNNGSINGSIDGLNTTSYTIPKGYTNGGFVNLTDDIKTELSNVISGSTVKTQVNAINTEVTTQTNLISQISTALQGKAAGGGSGGLPSGIKKIASDTVTPTSDVNTLVVNHDLGEAPNFCLWEIVDTDFSTTTGSSIAVAGATVVMNLKNSNSSSTVYNLTCMIRGYNSSGSLNYNTLSVSNNTYMTATTFTMAGSSAFKLKAGYTYRWVC